MLTPTLTREQVATALGATHPELGQLLRFKVAPLPVRVAGAALWFEDEVAKAKGRAADALKRIRERKARR